MKIKIPRPSMVTPQSPEFALAWRHFQLFITPIQVVEAVLV